jgi:hypothetical protein
VFSFNESARCAEACADNLASEASTLMQEAERPQRRNFTQGFVADAALTSHGKT